MDGGASEHTGGGSISDLGRLEGWWRTPGIALWSLVLFGAFLLNATLLLAFLKRPGLRTISNRFVMNLTISNLLTCAVLNPLLMLDTPLSARNFGICSTAEGATALVTTSSIFSVLLIAIDQYLAVVDPLRYRTRIDKLKCGILMISVWLISIAFGLIAALNPNPQSLWLVCSSQKVPNFQNTTLELTINASLFIRNSAQEFLGNFSFPGQEESVRLIENTSSIIEETFVETFSQGKDEKSFHLTYGIIYAVAYSVFAYLLPFIGVCWIYISIYSAAHKNSERTRRNGSRPILSSGSFSDEYYPVRQDTSTEDFRRLPKISSLSSIDESIETTPSHMPRRFSDHPQPSPIEEEPSTVIFTVGSQEVDVTPQCNITKESTSKVPISVLKAEFLGKKEFKTNADELVKSRFPDEPEQKRKSSYDLMYEEMMRKDLEKLRLRSNNTESSSSDDNDDDDDEDILSFEQNINNDVENGVHKEMENVVNSKENCLKNDEQDRRDSNGAIIYDNEEDIRSCMKGRTCFVNGKGNLRLSCHRAEAFQNNQEEVCRKFSAGNLETGGLFGTSSNAPIVTITPPNKGSLHRVSSTRSTSSYINSLKYRISNGSLFKYREETRAARVSALVIVMVLICWTPYVTVLILRNLPAQFIGNFPHEMDVLALSFLILAAYISPLLFGYRSRRVKRELRKLFCFKKELAYKNNRSLMAKKVLKRRHSGGLTNVEMDNRYNIFNCVYGKNKWPKDKVHFVQVPETALVVETCRSSFSSGASTQVSTTSTDEC